MAERGHWDRVYQSKDATHVSWYRPRLDQSIDLITRTGIGPDAAIADVGGGASTLVDDLLDRGFRNLTVVDISAAPLEATKHRLGARAAQVTWRVGDVTTMDFPAHAFDLWHDRAVFHFLTDEGDRRAYIERVCRSVRQGGFVIVATFGPHGPEKCSGLPVAHYSADELHHAFGGAFRLLEHRVEQHHTPWGAEQEFVYCLCAREQACD
jgi:ubiquinone/menaquinone biosynthesis C-methylase UbiE